MAALDQRAPQDQDVDAGTLRPVAAFFGKPRADLALPQGFDPRQRAPLQICDDAVGDLAIKARPWSLVLVPAHFATGTTLAGLRMIFVSGR
ncbi:hypothetical protein [Mesorhizobium sp. M0701]|uniref:hypothetical protein n=1 Tax=Mesorhizobium sp. M0701 TaxID=2956989 RepID=UPI00333DE16F